MTTFCPHCDNELGGHLVLTADGHSFRSYWCREHVDVVPRDDEDEKIEQRIAIDNNSINLSIINNKLDIIESIGDNWDDEGSIKGPNDFSIKFSRELAFKITENSFMPSVVTQSAEEGICFVFKSGNKFLYIEIYNDRELGLIIEDYLNKKTLKNMSIESSNDIIKEINSFYYL